ncbi:MAG: HD domain-containing protein [Clostridia bacterium]|nr:HD domain-containing protein [Clostridia bacterium]
MRTRLDEMNNMVRVDKVLENSIFRRNFNLMAIKEKKRIYCKHGMTHLIDTARIAYILSLENNLNIAKDVIYAAALLHDVGKIVEYTEGVEHNVVGAELCVEILMEAGFEDFEIEMIRRAILKHRDASIRNDLSLTGILYRADKLSRPCLYCKAEPKCDWSPEKKNMRVTY